MKNKYDILKLDLREQFIQNVKKEYSKFRMSGNLVKTIKRRNISDVGVYSVYINAPEYDIWKYWKKRIIIPLNTGSYAEDNDNGSGGLRAAKKFERNKMTSVKVKASNQSGYLLLKPTHHHNRFVQRNMVDAISSTLKKHNIDKYEIVLKGR